MIRFRLKTLLAFAVIVALAAIAWTLIPRSLTVWIENGNLVVFSSGTVRQGDPQLSGDPVLYERFVYVPLWCVGSLAAFGIAVCVGASMLVRVAIRRDRRARYSKP